MLTLEYIFAGARTRWPRQVVEMRRSAECGRGADQKPSVSGPVCVDMTSDGMFDTTQGESEIGCDSLGCGVTNM